VAVVVTRAVAAANAATLMLSVRARMKNPPRRRAPERGSDEIVVCYDL
jgi:hypothetical protein